MEKQTFWIIKKTGNPKFPYRLIIQKGKEVLLDLMAREKWPGTKGNIFCLRTFGGEDPSEMETLESVPVQSYRTYGKRVTIILDRPTRKRCSFLFLVKAYKQKEGEYEQIFWQTQQGLTQHKSKYKLAYNKQEEMTIFVDTGERYPWNFPQTETVREKLPLGDYAIKDNFGILAVAERKTFKNLMAEFGNLNKFHQHLSELENCKNSALVVEANYDDFLDKNKIKPYTGLFAAKAIAQIQSGHPKLPVVFAGSWKSASLWTFQFFQTVKAKSQDKPAEYLKEASAKYGAGEGFSAKEDEIRRKVFNSMPEEFTTRQLQDQFPECKPEFVRHTLDKLKNEGVVSNEKAGRNLIWKKRTYSQN